MPEDCREKEFYSVNERPRAGERKDVQEKGSESVRQVIERELR